MSATERLDYDDAYTTAFTGEIVGRAAHEGRPALALRASYFYPESGGQGADRGRIGGQAVQDVQTDADGCVWHVVDEHPAPDIVEAEIDWRRRFDFMQQHTGQHILSAAFERVAAAGTVSSRLGESRNTIDVALGTVVWSLVRDVEAAANAVIWENRPVARHWVDEAGLARFDLRKPPPTDRAGSAGRIRIVEIPDWDVSACGGTHTRQTGEVGVVKVVRWEKVRGQLRFEFLCGARALEDHAWRTELLVEGGRRHTVRDRELLEYLEQALADRDALRRQLDAFEALRLGAEARERVGDPPRPVSDWSTDRSREALRRFVILCLEAGAPWVVAGTAGPEPAVIVARAKGEGMDLRTLVPGLLERSGARGGGSPDFVTVAAADGDRAALAWRWAGEALGQPPATP